MAAVKRVAIQALEELAERQFGVFTELQAFYENVSKDMLRHHSRPGRRWRRVAPRVYEVVAQPSDWRRPVMAAQLSLGMEAVVSHRPAGALLVLDGVRPGPVELTVPFGRARPGWVLHRRRLNDAQVVYTGPIRHTSALQTLLDLATVLDDDTWEMALESALRLDLVAVGDLDVTGFPGAARVRRVLARRPPGTPPTGSELETRFIQLVRQPSILPEPERQVPVLRYRLDVAWPPAELFTELDGKWHNEVGPYDRSRQNEIVAMTGWRPLRYTWADVVHRPRTTLRNVEAAYLARVSGGGRALVRR